MIKPVFAGQAFLSRHQYAVRRIGDFPILRQGCRHMKHWILFLAVALATSEVHAFTRVWSNNSGGGWQVATNWTPPIVPGAGDVAVVTNLGTYSVQVTNNVTLDALFIGGPGSPTVVIDNNATLACSNNLVAAGGTMLWSNSWISGALTIQPGGQLLIASPAGVHIYSLTITNQGTVTWSSGSLTTGGTQIYNNGLWQITGPCSSGIGGSPEPVWINSGTLRKTGSGVADVGSFNFQNTAGGVVEAQSGTLQFNGGSANRMSGVFTNIAPAIINFVNGVWTDAGGIFSGTGTNTFSGNTFNLRTNVPPGLRFVAGDVWITGTNTFQNFGAITNLTIEGATLRGTNTVTGTLLFSSGSIPEKLTIATNGQLFISGTQNKLFYGLTLINQGTVTCGGNVSAGGGGGIINSGLWLFTGDFSVNNGSNPHIFWTNSGILRKTGNGPLGYSLLDANFVNQPGGLVESLVGRLLLNSDTNSRFGGTFNAVGMIELNTGTWTDAGAVMTGPGTNRFNSGTLNLRTNVPPSLLLAGGNVFITGTNTFQNAGSITNLTLDGATLNGTNFVNGGALTFNAGLLTGQMTVKTNGQLVFATTATKFVTAFNLINQGTVTVSSPNVNTGSTTISNGGLWQLAGDYGLYYGGSGTVPNFTNSGTVQKISGSGVAPNAGMNFFNQPSGRVQVDSGTLQLPFASTNFAGTLRLNGGTLNANGNFAVAGGSLDGAGTFGANNFTGGNISPGISGAGQMNFSAGLNLNSNVTLVIDGTGPVAGVSYDALSVTGAVVLANANLQITALPNFPAGTIFTLINNDSTDAVIGTFAGLPENSVVTVGAQTFRIHYAGGTGNDVTLVRDGVITGPQLAMQSYATNAWTFTGSNAIPLTAFTVRASTNLVTWTNIGVVTSSVSGAWSFTDTNAWRYARRFYNTTN
jgi:hypothetical protein